MNSKVSRPEGYVAPVSLPFELCHQLLRAAALVSMSIAAAHHGGGTWSYVAALAYAFLLGLLRLVNVLDWRHVALHHVNFVLFAVLLVIAAAELLPFADASYIGRLTPSTICSISTLAAAVFLALATPREWVPPSLDLVLSSQMPTREPAPEEVCSWLEYYLTFDWLTPLMLRGMRRQMTVEELPRLPWYDEPLLLLSTIQKARKKGLSTLRTIVLFQTKSIFQMAFWAFCQASLEFVAPFAMYELLDYLDYPELAIVRPWVWLVLLFAGPISTSISAQQYIFTSTRWLVRVKAGLTQELYYKAMGSMELDDEVFGEIAASKNGQAKSEKQQSTSSAGRLANLMSADIDAVTDGKDFFLTTVGISTGTVLALVGLYKLLGWPSLVGTGVMLLVTPLPMLITQRMVGLQREMKKVQDSRISVISEYLSSIRAIKYFAWEDAIIKKVDQIRVGEQKRIWRLCLHVIVLGELSESIPVLVLLLTFTLHVGVRHQQLTAGTAFTAITLIRLLRRNFSQGTYFTRNLTAAAASLRRLDRYFSNVTPLSPHPTGPLKIDNATFKRKMKDDFALENVSIDFVEGGLNVVTGPSGSGKSTLLMAILGETLVVDGIITKPKDIAFASQSPWLQNETIKDNILFNESFEPLRYERVIHACGLKIDFDEFPDRDETEVGENGTSLSGGQKSRIALARALYSKASTILLDDIFSALDAKTSASLWQEAFCGDLLHGRTVVLVTQLPWIAPQADLSIALEDGSVTKLERNVGVTRSAIKAEEALADKSGAHKKNGLLAVDTAAALAANMSVTPALSRINSIEAKRRDEVTQEALRTGQTARLQVLQYMRLFGNPFWALGILLLAVMSNAVYVITGLWIAVWVDAYEKDDARDVGFYLGVYAAWSFADVFFWGLSSIAYERGGWHAARTLHRTFMKAVMSVPLSWYKTTPIGRVVNRFSRDMYALDLTMAQNVRRTTEAFVRLCFQIVAVGSVMPIFMVPAAVCCSLGIVAGEIYTRTSVAVRRIVSSSQSPLFSQFADSLAGLPVIRARAGMPQVFGNRLAEKLRTYETAAEAQFNCNRWVALKVDMVTTLVTVAAGAIAVSKVGLVAAGIVGFSLSNAINLSQLIIVLVRSSNQLEVELQSFNRVQEYASVEPEEKPDEYADANAYSDDPEVSPTIPENWPRTGEVEFRNVTIKYDEDGPDILKNINLKFAAGERVAVVGRSGSGKSTLVLSLLRFTNIVSGQVLFDGVDITRLPRRRLREALTIIPQEAVLFNGDVASNLDPTGQIPQETLQRALEYCRGIASFQVHHHHHHQNNGEDGVQPQQQANGHGEEEDGASGGGGGGGISLATAVKAKGENFSHGQRQVLSLCRALVRRSRLMLLDEATASMDYETDRGIRRVLRREVGGGGGEGSDDDTDDDNDEGGRRTLVTIAHRLKTIIDYDRVVVMGAGAVRECGPPRDLYAAGGVFYDMMRHSGEFEELVEMLRQQPG
ncbi:ABC transporter [Xylariaceae sp. FL0804]|nr:ABC transporter [Xylariaceae sp. FL0804]